MPKITMKCVDCGKERTDYEERFKKHEEYRCRSCNNKLSKDSLWKENIKLGIQKHFKNIPSKKVIYKCVDCGEESKLQYPSYFKNNHITKENYRCLKCTANIRAQDPEWIKNNKIQLDNLHKDPVSKENQKEAIRKKFREDPLFKEKVINRIKNIFSNPETQEKYKIGIENRSKDLKWIENNQKHLERINNDPIVKENHKLAIKKRDENPDYKNKMNNAAIKRSKDSDWKKHNTEAMQKRALDLKWINKNKELSEKRSKDIKWRENNLIAMSGEGFWYGHKTLHNEKKYYCELWNRDLWNRIDAAWDYKSAISGKTKLENNNRHLSRHHVYWQKKACCVWDEDINGYYAWIINNRKKVKYYIKGDPNKFVLLTDEEHGIVKGNKEKDRIYWIKFFEDLIEKREKEDKKCYLSKEEYEVYIKNKINLN